jgi:hypothetical protein
MGEYLSAPIREKHSEEGENGKVSKVYVNIIIDKVWFVRDVRLA